MAQQRFELEVSIRDIEPRIWRRIEVSGAASLEDVHFALQAAIGWQNSHLHMFVVGKKRYGMTTGEFERDQEDEREFRLAEVVGQGDVFLYEYDFGDGWEHEIKVKQVSTVTKSVRPRCLDGARACPPEDCGGPGGYAELLQALADPKHERHEELTEWADGFEPEAFDLPKGGMDLRARIDFFKAAMAGGDDDDDDGDLYDAGIDLPPALLKQVMELEPTQRADLAAMISGSLADELVQAVHVAQQLLARIQAGAPRTTSGRGGWVRDKAHKPAKPRGKPRRK